MIRLHDLTGLLGAYGYEKQLDDPEHKRTRFKNESSFLDIWVGRKRTTVGVYDSHKKVMRYTRIRKLEDLEDLIAA